MSSRIYQFLLLAQIFCIVTSKLRDIKCPEELDNCLSQRRFSKNHTSTGHWYCVQEYRWRVQELLYKNITEETSNWIGELIRMADKQARQKRQTMRVRQEYRRLSDQQRANFHRAVNGLKTDTSVRPNRFDALGLLHQKLGDDVHHGAGFLGFHRVLLIIFENALRQKVPTVTLPYWDSRLDQPLRDYTRSIIWSAEFLGTVKGRVTNGPFAYWQTPAGPLVRNGGQEGELFTYRHVRAVMTRSHLAEISDPGAVEPYDFEIQHGYAHQHVGGIMAPAETAGFDPIFYLHHCFVDYLWELFRRSQREKGVDPTTDYPRNYGTAAHAPNHLMRLGQLRNIHGLSDVYTSRLYTYEPHPTCSYRRSNCRSSYLTCNFQIGRPRCVTLEMLETERRRPPRRQPFARGGNGNAQFSQGPQRAPNMFPQQQQQQHFGRVKRHIIMGNKMTGFGENVLSQFGSKKFRVYAVNKTISNKNRTVIKEDPKAEYFQHIQNGDTDVIVSPIANICPSSSSQNVIQNSFQMNKIVDTRVWVYIPCRVIYKRRPEQMKFESYPIRKGNIVSTERDIYDPMGYSELKDYFKTRYNTTRKCRDMDGIFTKVMIHTDGLNYHGSFMEFAILDSRHAFATSIAYIAVKNPEKWKTDVLLTAYDPCGNVCKPYCKRFGSFIPCDGAIRLTSEPPKMYGMNYGDATRMVWKISNDGIPHFTDEKVLVQFVCN